MIRTPQRDNNWLIIHVLAGIGEWAMMDFGLHGLLDRIERDFGKRAANALTIIIGLAIVAGCLTLVGNFITSFGLWLSSIASEVTWTGRLVAVVKYLLGFTFLVILANNFVGALSIRRFDRIVQRQFHELEELNAALDDQQKAYIEQFGAIREVSRELRGLIENVAEVIPEAEDLKRRLPPSTEEETPP